MGWAVHRPAPVLGEPGDCEPMRSLRGRLDGNPHVVRLTAELSTSCHGLDHSIRRGSATDIRVHAAVTFAQDNSQLPLGAWLPWQLCSGFAYVRPWAHIGMSSIEMRPADELSVHNFRLTSDPARALYAQLAAMHLIEEFLRPYQKRSNASLVQQP